MFSRGSQKVFKTYRNIQNLKQTRCNRSNRCFDLTPVVQFSFLQHGGSSFISISKPLSECAMTGLWCGRSPAASSLIYPAGRFFSRAVSSAGDDDDGSSRVFSSPAVTCTLMNSRSGKLVKKNKLVRIKRSSFKSLKPGVWRKRVQESRWTTATLHTTLLSFLCFSLKGKSNQKHLITVFILKKLFLVTYFPLFLGPFWCISLVPVDTNPNS